MLKVIDYWKRLTGHPKANKQAADRFDYVVARRSELYPFGDPVEDPPEEPCPTICLAIEGLAAYPYATKEGALEPARRAIAMTGWGSRWPRGR